jgi:hypothetical protein
MASFSYLKNLLLNSPSLGTGPSSHECKIPHEHLGRLRLASTTLATHQDCLTPLIIDQRPEFFSIDSNKEERRRSASLQPMNRIVSTEIMDQNTQTCSRRPRSRRDAG